MLDWKAWAGSLGSILARHTIVQAGKDVRLEYLSWTSGVHPCPLT